jgi:hypothetical protein
MDGSHKYMCSQATRTCAPVLTAMLAAIALAGCANTSLPSLPPPNLMTGGLPTLPIPDLTLPQADFEPTGTPTQMYTRIARGAQICWFGGNGALKAKYIFYADAEPPSKGGQSEIVIHERDLTTPNPRGARAFRVLVSPAGDTATLVTENIKFPFETGQKMVADVRRWARDDLSCASSGHTTGWTPNMAPSTQPSPPAPKASPPVRQRDT